MDAKDRLFARDRGGLCRENARVAFTFPTHGFIAEEDATALHDNEALRHQVVQHPQLTTTRDDKPDCNKQQH